MLIPPPEEDAAHHQHSPEDNSPDRPRRVADHLKHRGGAFGLENSKYQQPAPGKQCGRDGGEYNGSNVPENASPNL